MRCHSFCALPIPTQLLSECRVCILICTEECQHMFLAGKVVVGAPVPAVDGDWRRVRRSRAELEAFAAARLLGDRLARVCRAGRRLGAAGPGHQVAAKHELRAARRPAAGVCMAGAAACNPAKP